MFKSKDLFRKLLTGAAASGLCFAAASTQAATPFQVDVSTAIDRGITYLANVGAFNNNSSVGDSAGLAMQALLEKRASGNPGDPAQGYSGANATDQARLRTAAANILDRANETSFYAYRDGNFMFALAGYALTNGPDKSVLAPGNADYETIKQAMDRLVDRTLANQRKATNGYPNPINQGYWCYTNAGCEDSSTTQFAVAGLDAAKSFYKSAKSGDQAYADPARVALIDAALGLTKTAYELNAATGSDNGSCNVLTATERGHGYNSFNTTGYKPSLQQTASGIYIQLFGGSNVNSPMVQNYMQWLRNRYRWQDLDSLGNFWSGNSMGYYMWSSFKAMELIRQSGVAPAAGNLGPNDLGTLPAASAPACVVRQVNKDPATFARVPSFGAGAVGYYAAETKSQYFDYAHQILSMQCPDGSFTCTGFPGSWGDTANASHNSYMLLVLQRSTGNVIQRCDIDGDSDVDTNDLTLIRAAIGTVPGAADPRDATLDGKITVNDVRACTLQCTRTSCATQ
jgi:hypothetical protein